MQQNQRISVRNASPFSQPLFAQTSTGESVRITHVGDAEGYSPVYLCIDSKGKSGSVKQSEVTILDSSVLSNPTQALRNSSRNQQ